MPKHRGFVVDARAAPALLELLGGLSAGDTKDVLNMCGVQLTPAAKSMLVSRLGVFSPLVSPSASPLPPGPKN